ncbi:MULTISPECIES: hypothetical protein [Xanthomonas]|jgi:hypothetical protein|uniref:Uncharacterized protein n=2 Tax=Xanthomonas TaxID=338 RepID=A0A7Z7IY91_XANCH|nr:MULTISPECIES: hypothetical protein [Xanthomonas]WOP59013.1 hypothetical protein R5577_23125 [Xanthomonas euvesicatoria]SOO23782.1 conserved hypothetical protein [Xanthomonas phaseoli pv. phaseoli]
MASAAEFQSVGASVFPSQDREVVLNKQPALAEHGREVRSAINQLPPEVSQALLREYGEPSPQMIAQAESAIISRELAIESAAQEANLDKDWAVSGGANRRMDEVGLSAGDEWNEP